jgi:hypothetical protein
MPPAGDAPKKAGGKKGVGKKKKDAGAVYGKLLILPHVSWIYLHDLHRLSLMLQQACWSLTSRRRASSPGIVRPCAPAAAAVTAVAAHVGLAEHT